MSCPQRKSKRLCIFAYEIRNGMHSLLILPNEHASIGCGGGVLARTLELSKGAKSGSLHICITACLRVSQMLLMAPNKALHQQIDWLT